jgi:hypothetical protein
MGNALFGLSGPAWITGTNDLGQPQDDLAMLAAAFGVNPNYRA